MFGLARTLAPRFGVVRQSLHRLPDLARNEWDAVERVLTILEDRFMVGVLLL
jgi:hypothetical protein